ncbi:MAG: zinc-finger domain-containing protein [Betaproteobacteria bacterium]
MSGAQDSNDRTITITRDDLPLHCPWKDASLWSQHPRVFLDVEDTGECLCPYCGNRYVLKGGPSTGGH